MTYNSLPDALPEAATPTRPPTVQLTPENIAHLKTYPRPPKDNGIGLHFHIDLSDLWIGRTVENLLSIRATWTLIYAQDEQQAKRAAAACWREGIMPVVRIGKLIDQGFDPAPYVRALLEIGAPPYVQVHNEPEDTREWRDGERPAEWAGIFGRNWARSAREIVDAGGMPGIQVLDRPGFDAAVDAVAASGRTDIWNRAFFVHHNYGANHPPAYPYDARNQQDRPGSTIVDDHISVLKFQAHASWMQERLGRVLPLIGGEGGWLFGAEEDSRYPKVEHALHAQYHRELFDGLRTGVLGNGEPLPDYLFSITPWIAGSFTFAAQNWWNNIIVPEGKLTATIEAVQAIPIFERQFSWSRSVDPGPAPGPGPEPEPGPGPEPEPDPGPDPAPELQWDPRLDALGVRLERKPDAIWRLVQARFVDEVEADGKHHVLVKALRADGSPAAGVRFVADWVGRRPDEDPPFGTTDASGDTTMHMFIILHTDRKDGIIFTTTTDAPGDVVHGMGLPDNHHVCYALTYRRRAG